ncbi:MAG: hypothetical protein CMB80_08765 [Flammeovirgaceae bacterium]|nr:hypothetical protein [Flammeovirgaceae bacterium]|tara:strand:- start:2231 stop:2800 length:570 start_codon:yes stop_codon:yes gene_type:complete
MGYISPITEVILNDWAVTLAVLVFLFNLTFRLKQLAILCASGVVVTTYIAGIFVLEYINSLPADTSYQFRYALRLCLHAVALTMLLATTKLYTPTLSTKMVAYAFSFNIAMQLALHVDRVHIGLNHIGDYFATGEVINNRFFDGGYWWLWDFYTESLNAVAWALFIYLLVGDNYKENARWGLQKLQRLL